MEIAVGKAARAANVGKGGLLLGVGGLTLLAYVVTAAAQYHSNGSIARRPLYNWFGFGTDANIGLSFVNDALGHALLQLDARSDQAHSLSAYRQTLETCDGVLRSLVADHPLNGKAIHRLAAVNYELTVLRSSPDSDRTLTLLDLAAARSPRSVDFQLSLASTLFRMGEHESAIRSCVNAVRLRADSADRAIRLMLEYGVTIDDMVRSLPLSPEVLAALKGPFLNSQRGLDYLGLVDNWRGQWSTDLLASFGDACLLLYRPALLAEVLLRLGPLSADPAEARRQYLLGWAAFSQRDFISALRFATNACRLEPQEPAYFEFLGDCEQECGRGSDALAALEGALGRSTQASWTTAQRARIYRKIGQVYESIAMGDKAYDAYRRSLELNPSESIAADRMQHFATTR
jgi:hypothetical protein